MDKVTNFRSIIKRILTPIAQNGISSDPSVKIHFVNDSETDEFILMMIGWSRHRYSHGLLMHLQIVNGKVWVHQDRTDFDIGNLLVEEGIPKSDVVLGFVEPMLRGSHGFAEC
jgi:hypothetical protein